MSDSTTIVVKGMDASHNVLATDTYTIAGPPQPEPEQGQTVRVTGTARNMNETVVRTNPRGSAGTSTYTYSGPSGEEEFDITLQWPTEVGIIKSKTYTLQTRQAEFNSSGTATSTSNLYANNVSEFGFNGIYTNQAANWRNIKVYIDGDLAYEQPDSPADIASQIRGPLEYLNINS